VKDGPAVVEVNSTERALWQGSDDDRSGERRGRHPWNDEERERRPRQQYEERNEDD
jgi:hypothetical protein